MSLLLLLLACKPDAASAPATAAVSAELQTAAVLATPYAPTVELTGTLAPIASVQLGFDVPGRMTKLLVERGQSVRRGQVVAQLDARMAVAQLEQAEAALAGAEAQLAAGEAAWKRVQQLHAVGGVSEQQYTDAEGQIAAARAGIDQARAGLSLARTYVDNHSLRAPIDGVVSNGPDNPGTMVGAGTPLFLIEDLSALRVKASAPESATWIHAGLPAKLRSGIPGDASSYEGSVVRVLPALDPATRRIPVEVDVPGGGALRAWGYARIQIVADVPVAAWKAPRAALVARPDFCVFTRAGEVVKRVPVEVLAEEGDQVVLRAELAEGDQVVLNPPNGLGE